MTETAIANIVAAASIVAAISSSISAAGVFLLWRQIRADHERARREKAIELMEFYNTVTYNVSVSGRIIRELLLGLDRSQCENLFNMQAMKIDATHRELLTAYLKEAIGTVNLVEEDEMILLSREEVIALRQQVFLFLNVVETIAAAWRHNVADQDIIEEEFKAIVSPKKGIFLYEELRTAIGLYPSISELSRAIREKEYKRLNKPPIL